MGLKSDIFVTSKMKQLCLVILIIVIVFINKINSWHYQWNPNSYSTVKGIGDGVQYFHGSLNQNDYFRVIGSHDKWMLIGGRNVVHNISLINLQVEETIEWPSDKSDMNVCRKKQKNKEECQNYIRVIVPKSPNELYICGTNSFSPSCRTYLKDQTTNKYVYSGKKDSGMAKCPYHPKQNYTFIYTDQKLITATIADFSERDAVIINNNNRIRTEQYDSEWLNKPDFVSSMEKGDDIFFFFRENAVENINCGKATFSRVARVCKNDQGGNDLILNKKWTSFLKARLNCSIPGQYPFNFDEIQATTELGQGNYRPVADSGDRGSMVYGVFTTNENSIPGSAICAYSHQDIVNTLRGKFKGQESAVHNWLPIPDDKVPEPHPYQCTNNSGKLPVNSLNFIRDHNLMDAAVPLRGGAPILVHASFTSKFTAVAVDWQVFSGNGRYYDIIFVGTSDGRVIKAINKGETSKIETVIIEDIQVFEDKSPIVNLKLYKGSHLLEKLVVVSEKDIVSIPLHRCHEKKSCHECVALQDPYCSWNENKCLNSERGIKNIQEGKDDQCGPLPVNGISKPTTTTTKHIPPPPQNCKCEHVQENMNFPDTELPERIDNNIIPNREDNLVYPNIPEENGNIINEGGRFQEVRGQQEGAVTASTLAIALVVAIVLSLVLGFLIGYKVSMCRGSRDIETPYLERNIAMQKSKNRLSSTGENVYCNPDSALQKQLNYVVNVKNQGKLNSSVETKPVHKSNKVYL